MISGATIVCTSADETLAVLVVTPELNGPLGEEASIGGVMRGPYCERARTLPAEFVLKLHDNGTLVAMVVDPCYSTAELKMDYELELWSEQQGLRSIDFETRVELKKK
ncbi:hypothetical protein [Aeoliella sp. SH292]|uniref:hypothetical protein n=1 Tax=Aeoliella sp. SH292 TaxID=3454464 RepID=UPI003F9A6338